jgi:hypothetical protein
MAGATGSAESTRTEALWFVAAAGGKCAQEFCRNFARVLLGRGTRVNEHRLFLWQYLLHVTGMRAIRKITCTGLPGEGAGSQALMVMNAINFARFFGLRYVHTPFRVLSHAERPIKEWAGAWEAHFNLGAGEAACGPDRSDAVNFCYNFSDLDRCLGWCGRWDELAEHFKEMIEEFKEKYGLNKTPRGSHEVRIAVHVRRGDVQPQDTAHYTSNRIIERTMKAVKSILDRRGVKYRISIYSKGPRSDFEEVALPGVEFFLDADALWTMREMIEADVLIMAKGCYSYCAGLLSDGIKIFQPVEVTARDLPGWKWLSVPVDEDWIVCRGDGTFDLEVFERRVPEILERAGGCLSRPRT